MWKVPGPAQTLTALLAAMIVGANAAAEEIHYTQNQTSFTLPGVTLPQGQDEIRSADSTTCRSAVAGSGAYLDVGVIQGSGLTYGSRFLTFLHMDASSPSAASPSGSTALGSTNSRWSA